MLIAILGIKSLKALDLSKNKFHPENVMCLLRHAANAENLEVLILSSIESLNNDTASYLINMIT